MEKIKVGEYVRSKQGYISKITEISPRYIWFDSIIMINEGISFNGINIEREMEYIVKHSKNIIDLIEDGDYVNGLKIISMTSFYINEEKITNFEVYCGEVTFLKILYEKQIKSIVTKEQFKSVEYRVEE